MWRPMKFIKVCKIYIEVDLKYLACLECDGACPSMNQVILGAECKFSDSSKRSNTSIKNSQLQKLQEKVNPFLPVSKYETKQVDQCPSCSINSHDGYWVNDSYIEDCFNGNIFDDEYDHYCDDDEYCAMYYYYDAYFNENGDVEHYCSIQYGCRK